MARCLIKQRNGFTFTMIHILSPGYFESKFRTLLRHELMRRELSGLRVLDRRWTELAQDRFQ